MANVEEHSVISTAFMCYADHGDETNLTSHEVALFNQWVADTNGVFVGEDYGTGMCQITGKWGELFTLLSC